jgi:hypothetical protein
VKFDFTEGSLQFSEFAHKSLGSSISLSPLFFLSLCLFFPWRFFLCFSHRRHPLSLPYLHSGPLSLLYPTRASSGRSEQLARADLGTQLRGRRLSGRMRHWGGRGSARLWRRAGLAQSCGCGARAEAGGAGGAAVRLRLGRAGRGKRGAGGRGSWRPGVAQGWRGARGWWGCGSRALARASGLGAGRGWSSTRKGRWSRADPSSGRKREQARAARDASVARSGGVHGPLVWARSSGGAGVQALGGRRSGGAGCGSARYGSATAWAGASSAGSEAACGGT